MYSVEHIVPLSHEALSLIRGLPRIGNPARFVFTTYGTSPVSGYSKAKKRLDQLMHELRGGEEGGGENEKELQLWVFHDIRRTVASGMRRNGQPLDVVEKVLNHVGSSFSGIRGVYQKYDHMNEKRTALQVWVSFKYGRVVADGPPNVLPIRAVHR